MKWLKLRKCKYIFVSLILLVHYFLSNNKYDIPFWRLIDSFIHSSFLLTPKSYYPETALSTHLIFSSTAFVFLNNKHTDISWSSVSRYWIPWMTFYFSSLVSYFPITHIYPLHIVPTHICSQLLVESIFSICSIYVYLNANHNKRL